MTLKELEDRWHRSRLSPLGIELWDSFAEPDWHYPNGQGNYGEEFARTHIEHIKTKVRVALNFKHEQLSVYFEHGPTMAFVLDKLEQKILLKRYRECCNKQIAFQFQIAPFKNNTDF